ncbi:hypothetical protein BC829DRAFT_358505, partial [Chytridium lagenaria]
RLEEDSRCQCGFSIEDSTSERCWMRGTLYTETAARPIAVETARCSVCPGTDRRFIGPDMGSHGIFNKNNVSFYTHRLMDMMTEFMTSTEFSFTVFIATRKTCYYEFALGKPHAAPPSVRVFTAAYFAYRKLQDLSRRSINMDVQCPFCSVNGYDLVACDGISIGYSIDRQTLNLAPPTRTYENSPRNDTVK